MWFCLAGLLCTGNFLESCADMTEVMANDGVATDVLIGYLGLLWAWNGVTSLE